MADVTYNIVYTGKLLDGHDVEGVKSNLVREFALSREKAEQLLKSKRAIIKKNLDQAAAKKMGMALTKVGLKVVMTPYVIPEASAPLPRAAKDPGPLPEEPVKTLSRPEQDKITQKTLPFAFHGTGSEYFKIWIVNLILSIITLGIYSAWAKVRRKQYLYGSTRLQNASFAYLADPIKILKGRVIVMVFFVFYSIVSEFFPLAGGVLSLLFLVILPWLVVRALTFNARNSAYRNICFDFNGTVKEAFKVFLLWPILTPLTLGILFPYAYFRQKKFIVENSCYGKTGFAFNTGPKAYYRVITRGLVPIILGLVLVGGSFFVLPLASGLFGMVVYLYLFAYFSVEYTNLLFNSTTLASHQLKADQKPMEYLVLVFTNTLGMVFTLGIFYPWAHVRVLTYKLDHLKLDLAGDLNHFVAQEQQQVSALGDEASDFFDFDIGL